MTVFLLLLLSIESIVVYVCMHKHVNMITSIFFLFFVKKTTLIYITLHIILKENLFRVRDSSPLTESYFFPQVYSLPVNEMCDDSCVRELMILSK